MDDKDKRVYIGELQNLQRQINSLKNANKSNPEPSIERTIDILRNSQDKLYSALSYHGVTAEEVHQVIIENSDKQIVSEIMKLQSNKDKINKQLAEPNLSPEKRQNLEADLAEVTQEHVEKWDGVIADPDKDRIIDKIEQAQLKALAKENRDHDKDHDEGRSR